MNIQSITITIKKGSVKGIGPCTDYAVEVEAVDPEQPVKAMEAMHLLAEAMKMIIDDNLSKQA